MSYPHVFQPLVIEDDQHAKEYYDEIFLSLKDNGYNLAPTQYAFCCTEAQEILQKSRILHLVVLDLRIPNNPSEPAPDGISLGLDILKLCSERNNYPIPALLVISGHLDKVVQGDLDQRVRSNFSHGRVLTKGGNLEKDIEMALEHVAIYCGIGIHLSDSGSSRFPTVSPREEDLLRRSILEQGLSCGVDLRWWSAEYEGYLKNSLSNCWTKVLMGSFLLDKGRGNSRPTFFKFGSASGAENILADARLMEHKLAHIKVCSALVSGDRSLLVTQKVGEVDDEPITLGAFLQRHNEEVGGEIQNVVAHVAKQLDCFGDSSPDQRPICEMLWQFHDLQLLERQWKRFGGISISDQDYSLDAISLFKHLQGNVTSIPFKRLAVLHGDLNISNIAIEMRDNRAYGYIFDASGSAGGANVKDLASLEVTAVLHQHIEDGNLVQGCLGLYGDTIQVPENFLEQQERPHTVQNTVELIHQIRTQALKRASPELYSLMVFDYVMLQLGGLGVTVSHNKIANPNDVPRLCGAIAHWFRKVASMYC